MFVKFKIKKEIYITACLSLSQVLLGYLISWSVPVMPILQNNATTPLYDVVTILEASWLTSIFNVGVIFGCLLIGWFSNEYGRKTGILLSICIIIFGLLILNWAKSYSLLVASRIILGVGCGAHAVVNVVYLGEIASPNIRGILLTCLSIAQCFGVLLVCAVGPFVPYPVICYIAFALAFLFSVTRFFITESPMFHLIKDNEQSAIAALEDLGRVNDIQKELSDMIQNVEYSKAMNWKQIFTDKFNKKGFFITINLFINQQWSGMLVSIYFCTTVFQAAGSSIKPELATIIVCITSLVATSLVPLVIDRFGRRSLLITSNAGCCLCMFIMGLYFFLDQMKYNFVEYLRWLPLVTLILMNIIYSIGLGVIPNTLISEMFRPNVRSAGSSIVMTIGFLSGFLSSLCFGYMVDYVGIFAIFWIYAAIDFYGFIFSILFVPETKGLSLIQIERKLG